MRAATTVMHLDADAFFAAVEQRQRPSLRGKPVIVGGVGPRGVVATASYEARRFGVHSAQSGVEARRRCPSGVFLSPRFVAYSQHSAVIMSVLRELSDLVEPVSMDEAFVDLAAGGHADDPADAGRWAKDEIYRRCGLHVSVGLGRSKLIAKLASDADKPNGFTVVDPDAEDAFLLPKPVEALWGVGPATQKTLARVGIRSVADLRASEPALLVSLLGRSSGTTLHRLAHGVDERAVVAERETKSVGAERTFASDVAVHDLPQTLAGVFPRALERLHRTQVGARTVTVKIRLADFTTMTRAASLAQPSQDPELLLAAAQRALAGAQVREPVRLLGVTFSGLAEFAQLTLGADADAGVLSTVADPVVEVGDPAGSAVPAAVPLSPESCTPGLDVEHPVLGRGWLVDRSGPQVRVRFEGPDTEPADRDRLFDARVAGLLVVGPPPPGPYLER